MTISTTGNAPVFLCPESRYWQASKILTGYNRLHYHSLKRLQKQKQKKMMTAKQAAEYLGYSVKYLYKLVHYGIIPYAKPNGGKLMFDQDRLKEWVNNGSNYSDRIREAATYITAKK